jgi:ubiquinone/menaquinone biosynthesis C-methylase UbiE
MDDDAQARAYAEGDFEEAHAGFIEHFRRVFGKKDVGSFALDLGCGPGDITIRFARANPTCTVHGVDGSSAMLRAGEALLDAASDVRARVNLIHGLLPGARLPRPKYETIISNSLLHHLPDAQILWNAVRRYAQRGARVFVMDLARPPSVDVAKRLVDAHAGNEPEVLRRDFYNSLLAAFEPDEVRMQLEEAGLEGFSVEPITNRHQIITGRAP